MNAPEKFFLPDVQSSADHRALAIQHVGVRGLRYPMAVRDLDGGVQHTVATLEMTVGLPADVKGTHMSPSSSSSKPSVTRSTSTACAASSPTCCCASRPAAAASRRASRGS